MRDSEISMVSTVKNGILKCSRNNRRRRYFGHKRSARETFNIVSSGAIVARLFHIMFGRTYETARFASLVGTDRVRRRYKRRVIN